MYNNKGRTRGFKEIKQETDRRAIRILQLEYWWPDYWDEGVRFRGGHEAHKWRSYRTWKHNRKTQYKFKNQI